MGQLQSTEKSNKMETLNRTLNTAVKNADPRIDSPQIQVIYPSETAPVKDAVSSASLSPVTTTHAPALPLSQSEDKILENPSVIETQPKNEVPPAVQTWVDVLKQNATLFIVVSLITLVAGIFIGKKL